MTFTTYRIVCWYCFEPFRPPSTFTGGTRTWTHRCEGRGVDVVHFPARAFDVRESQLELAELRRLALVDAETRALCWAGRPRGTSTYTSPEHRPRARRPHGLGQARR